MSVAYRFAESHDQLNQGRKDQGILASSGSLRESPVCTQIIADGPPRSRDEGRSLNHLPRCRFLLADRSIANGNIGKTKTQKRGGVFRDSSVLLGIVR